MQTDITLSNGLESFNLIDNTGKKWGEIAFNPSDPALLVRFSEVLDEIGKINIDISDEMTLFEQIAALKKANDKIESCFDYLFGAGSSKQIFSAVSACSILPDGSFMFEQMLEKIADIMNVSTKKRASVSRELIKKYTRKYAKK